MPSPLTPDASRLPRPFSAGDAARGFDAWTALKATGALAEFMQHAAQGPGWKALLAALFGTSPYLTHLALGDQEALLLLHTDGPDAALDKALHAVRTADPALDQPGFMRHLRAAKARVALIAAVADIAGAWPLERVTAALSALADTAVARTVDYLLLAAAKRGDISLADHASPARGSGFIVFGMGKLGALELNYSSDIDLIFFYEPGRLDYRGRRSERQFFCDVVQDAVHILQQRTPQGYVFRTDIRLRPDPASTPPAVSVDAALRYYESVGQNWERAAMIKARPIAGDLEAGEALLAQLSPFVWRRNLDFAAINDILSIKRQMHARAGQQINVPGHNIKIGVGGIREIELFAQIHQLIWGGREPGLRTRGTCETLVQLRKMKLAAPQTETRLHAAYRFLRTLEHRLQMIADQQTHTLPATAEGLAQVAAFMGFATTEEFSAALLDHAHAVHDIFAASFRSAEPLAGEGNLVFTGVSHDPETLETLARMGYKYPQGVSKTVMGWHRGSRRCTRTKRARQLLTELVPRVLESLSETANPDGAFARFDAFLMKLPAGVQLFSLFAANPRLLSLIADIMGSAPALADTLGRHPDLIESVLYPGFFDPLPERAGLAAQLAATLTHAADFETRMEALRRFKNEKQFQAGVQLLKASIDAQGAGAFLSALADTLLQAALATTQDEFASSHGRIPGGKFCVLGLGSLGSREMTFGSDADLVFVYEAPEDAVSDGAKSFGPSVYYSRLAQRYLNALTTLGREGRLYAADMRLRPSGDQGLPAVSVPALEKYFRESAWTFEHMALVRARPVAGDVPLQEAMEAFRRAELTRPRDNTRLRADVAAMRERVAAAFPPRDPWDLKHARGGLLDLDFIAQYLLLAHAPAHPQLLARATTDILANLQAAGLLEPAKAERLIHAYRFFSQLLHLLRLTLDGPLEQIDALPGLGKRLAEATGAPDFAALSALLLVVEREMHAWYTGFVSTQP